MKREKTMLKNLDLPGVYLINSTGECCTLWSENGEGDHKLFREFLSEKDIDGIEIKKEDLDNKNPDSKNHHFDRYLHVVECENEETSYSLSIDSDYTHCPYCGEYIEPIVNGPTSKKFLAGKQ